jgi:flagellar hook protein FlgE
MSSAIANALSGLNANSSAINVVSGNLANLNTTGYKDIQVSFEDLVNQSLSGFTNSSAVSGSTVAQTVQQFTQGTLQTTGGAYDAAIQGGGFFVVQQPAGATEYTRQGNFQVNAEGQLMTANGQYVQGWNISSGTLTTTGPTSNIILPNTLSQAPVPTSSFSLDVNLNANAVVGSPAATFSSPIEIYDAQGVAHTLTVTYTETAANTWGYAVTIPAADLTNGGSTTLASGTLTFDGTGKLLTPDAAGGAITCALTGLADGAADIPNLTWNLYSSNGNPTISQNTQASQNISSSQDGSQASQLANMAIGANGTIVATFSNGTTENVAQLALASVLNPDSMVQVDGNSFLATGNTATPVVGMPGTGARGNITGGALETSTVDIATELTSLLTYERGYEANSKVITTEDNIVQNVLTLIPAQ